jgi:RNA polymerase sigma factor (TIGR02999 family)
MIGEQQLRGEQLFNKLYADLHRLAQRELRRQGGGITLGATSLLHEAYLDVSGRPDTAFPDRARFMAYASRAMRGLIIDYARSRQAQKRGGRFEIMPLNTQGGEPIVNDLELTRISDGLEELAKVDPPLAQLVDLKFFCGFSFQEIAGMRQVCERTVRRDWEKARLYLNRAMREEADSGSRMADGKTADEP